MLICAIRRAWPTKTGAHPVFACLHVLQDIVRSLEGLAFYFRVPVLIRYVLVHEGYQSYSSCDDFDGWGGWRPVYKIVHPV